MMSVQVKSRSGISLAIEAAIVIIIILFLFFIGSGRANAQPASTPQAEYGQQERHIEYNDRKLEEMRTELDSLHYQLGTDESWTKGAAGAIGILQVFGLLRNFSVRKGSGS